MPAAIPTHCTCLPGIVAKLSGKLNLHPVCMTGHTLCKAKATVSSALTLLEVHPQPRDPLLHQEREKQLQENRDPIWTPTSPGRFHYLRDPDPRGHHHKGPRAAKIQTGGTATCKHNRVKSESNKERAQLPHPTPKPHSPHPWGAEGLLLHTQPHLSTTTSLLCAAQAELYRTWCRLHTGAVFLLPKGQRVCTCVLLRCSLLVVRRWGEGLIGNLEVMLKLWHWLLYTILRHFLLISNLLSLFYCQMLHRKKYTFVNFFFKRRFLCRFNFLVI